MKKKNTRGISPSAGKKGKKKGGLKKKNCTSSP